MLDVFLDVVLPVALVAILGGIVGRWRRIPVAPISTLVFYLLSPALAFHSMANTQLSAGVSARIFGVMLLTYVIMYAASVLWSVLRRHDAPMRAAFALAATTPNVGNMGLPVSQLAFGDLGLQVAVVNFVAGSFLVNTLGIALASTSKGLSREVLKAPFRYPALYAAIACVAVKVLDLELPMTIALPVESLSNAAIPTMLVVLGLQLQNIAAGKDITDSVAVNLARLIIAPGAAWLAATVLGLDGTTRGTLVVLAAMPTAVIAIIIATEFKAHPEFLTRIVVSSTLLSMITLTVLISLLR